MYRAPKSLIALAIQFFNAHWLATRNMFSQKWLGGHEEEQRTGDTKRL
jgi:hypothetical protein